VTMATRLTAVETDLGFIGSTIRIVLAISM
jgi:hypothetical protein